MARRLKKLFCMCVFPKDFSPTNGHRSINVRSFLHVLQKELKFSLHILSFQNIPNILNFFLKIFASQLTRLLTPSPLPILTDMSAKNISFMTDTFGSLSWVGKKPYTMREDKQKVFHRVEPLRSRYSPPPP